MVDGASDEASLDQKEGDDNGDYIGAPSGPDGGEVSGLAEGEEDGGGEHEAGAHEDGHGDASGGTAVAEDDAERGGDHDDGEADPGLGPAIIPLGEEAAFIAPLAFAVRDEPAVETGDAEVIGTEAGLDEFPRGFFPAGEGEGLVGLGGEGVGEGEIETLEGPVAEGPLVRFAGPGGGLGLEFPVWASVRGEGSDDDALEWFAFLVVIGEAADEPEALVILLKVDDVSGLADGAFFGLVKEAVLVADGPGSPAVVKSETEEADEEAHHDEGEDEAGDAAPGLDDGDDFLGAGELAEGEEHGEEEAEGGGFDKNAGEGGEVVLGHDGGSVFAFFEVREVILNV